MKSSRKCGPEILTCLTALGVAITFTGESQHTFCGLVPAGL